MICLACHVDATPMAWGVVTEYEFSVALVDG